MLTGPDDINRIDRFAAVLAALTTLHCVFAPFLPSAMGGEASHAVAAVACMATSVPACVRGWSAHGDARVWAWALPGWALLGLARLASGERLGEAGEVVATVIAGVLLVVAHQLNRSLAYWHDRE